MEIRYLKDEDGSVSQAVSCDEDDLQSKTNKKTHCALSTGINHRKQSQMHQITLSRVRPHQSATF